MNPFLPSLLALLVSTQGAAAVPSQEGTDRAVPAAPTTVPTELPLEHATELRAIGAALRAARSATDTAPLVQQILRAGPGALEAAFDVLVRVRVPESKAGDAPQVLSAPQRAVLLVALARMPQAKVRAHVADRIRTAPPDTGEVELAAVRLLGAIGTAADLKRMPALAPHRAGDDETLTRDASAALRDSTAAILVRDAAGWALLPGIVRTSGRSAARALLEAVGTLKDPHALAVLYESVTAHPDLSPLATASVQLVGPSLDPEVTRAFAEWMADRLPSARKEHKEGLLRGIGALDDGTHAQLLIDTLEDEEPQVREAAAWGLRRLTGFGYAATPEPWRAWLDGEIRWQEDSRDHARQALAAKDPAAVAAALREYVGRRAWRESLAEDVAVVLERDEPQLRLLACEVLQGLHALSSIRPMAQLLAAPEEGVRDAARRALGKISGLDLPADPQLALEALELL